MSIRATDGERNYAMPIAKGDRVRLFQSTRAAQTGSKGGTIGRNGSVLEVIAADAKGIWLKARSGKVGQVLWKSLEAHGRTKLAYGDAMTIHTAQGSTTKEHITAYPAGSQAVDGKLGYSGNTRHQLRSWLVTNEAAEREAVRKSRALNDNREISLNDRWANVARALAWQPEKDTALALFDRIGSAKRGGVREMNRAMPDVRQAKQFMQVPDVAEARQTERSVAEARKEMAQAVQRLIPQRQQAQERAVARHRQGPSLGR
jgi:hypothetical protein